jgi:hypothetical protein
MQRTFKAIAALSVLALSACGHIVTLYPRGGDDQATGTLNDGSRNMSVNLKGSTYTGKFVPGQTFGFAVGQSLGAASSFGTAMMVGMSVQKTGFSRAQRATKRLWR